MCGVKHGGERTKATDAKRHGRSKEAVDRQCRQTQRKADTREICSEGAREWGNRQMGIKDLGAVTWKEAYQAVDICLTHLLSFIFI